VHSAVSCTKRAEPVETLFGIWTPMGPTGGAHTGATWRIPLNRPCAAAMRPVAGFVEILEKFAKSSNLKLKFSRPEKTGK